MVLEDPARFVEHTLSEIWNRKQIGRIYDAYQHNVQLHTPHGRLYGREEVIRSCTLRLAAFPNLSYAVEDLVCAPGRRDRFRVAVRWSMVGENTGHSTYGSPTGREVAMRGISHFYLRHGRIVEQWTVDNELGLIRQLGFDTCDSAARLACQNAPNGRSWGDVERVVGQATPQAMPPNTTQAFNIEDLIRRSRHKIWNWRLLGEMDEVYGRDAAYHLPSEAAVGDGEAFEAFVLSLLAAFPDLVTFVDDVLWSDDGQGRYRASARWTLLGTHRGPGPYGPPSGKRVRVIGITNYVAEHERIVEQWTELGEFALLKQIHASGLEEPEVPEYVGAAEDRMVAEEDREAENEAGN